jgi:hypothetical protein
MSLQTTLGDRIWAFLGAQALKRLFGPFCEEYEAGCPSCEAQKLALAMQEICYGD